MDVKIKKNKCEHRPMVQENQQKRKSSTSDSPRERKTPRQNKVSQDSNKLSQSQPSNKKTFEAPKAKRAAYQAKPKSKGDNDDDDNGKNKKKSDGGGGCCGCCCVS